MQSDESPTTSFSTPLHVPNKANDTLKPSTSVTTSHPRARFSIFTTPEPLKRLFNQFPLYTYPANELPLGASASRAQLGQNNTLYIFTDPRSASDNRKSTSLNPTCLRYQALLVLAGIPFEIATANNHASPSGSLPYLVTGSNKKTATPKIIPTAGLKSFTQSQPSSKPVDLDANSVHLASLEPIRHAYLAALYLDDETFKSTCVPLYIDTASRSRFVRAALVSPLRAAALEEVTGSCNEAPAASVTEQLRALTSTAKPYDEDLFYDSASDALAALSALLGDSAWYGRKDGRDTPGWLDVSLFAYIHVILSLFGDTHHGADKGMVKCQVTGAEKIYQAVARHRNLVSHRDRILAAFG